MISLVDTFTRLSKCILCQSKFVSTAISIGFGLQEYRSDMQFFFQMDIHDSFMGTFTRIPVYIMQL